jgi:hypothetical protein
MFAIRRRSNSFLLLACLLSYTGVAGAQLAVRPPAQPGPATYQVTVTSLIHGTPPSLFPSPASAIFAGTSCNDANKVPRVGEMLGLWMVATSDSSFSLFTEGQPAIPDLARLSQTGRPFYLANTLQSNSHVGNVFTIPANPMGTLPNPIPFPPPTGVGGIVLCPGQALTFTVTAQGAFQYLNLAAMVFPTNDSFTAITGVQLPTGTAPLTVYAPAYDSGSEENDELCGNIPSLIVASFPFPATTIGGATLAKGAACPDGSGAQDFNSDPVAATSPDNLPRAEGVVHIHPGIRGVGDLAPSVWNWENPVMKVVIQKM